mmetsp:Transcript_24735/g.36744  ORF Transcript_24735/g.36744 Transcript_24735/m.36744 type:complete len:105 (-) Transcript_24735:95-409(-)
MNIVYTNYVAAQQQNEANQLIYSNYVASNLGRRRGLSKVDTSCAEVKIIATSSGTDGSIRDSRENERQIHAKMLEQGTLHKCAMLQYNMARTSSAKLDQFTTIL